MVPSISRLISLFLLLFILLHEKDCCTARTHQDTKKNNLAADDAAVLLEVTRTEPANVDKVIFDGVPTGAEVVGATKLKGRKMMSKRSLQGKETVLNEKESTIPGVAHAIHGNCKRKRKGSALNVERKLRNRSHQSTNGHHKVKMAGFAAFSADYRVPKSHPPRNN